MKRQKLTSLSFFFPCFNDRNTIGKLILQANKIGPKIAKDWEIVVVNDGSYDDSLIILKNLKKTVKRLKIVNHNRNTGYGGALFSGFKNATKEVVFYTDGDGQYRVQDIYKLLPLLDDQTDFVNGIKQKRSDEYHRILLGKAYNWVAQRVFGIKLTDIDCDYRLIRRSILTKIDLTCRSGAVCAELVKKSEIVGARFREVMVSHCKRRFGKSEFFRIRPLLHTATEFIKLWFDLRLILSRPPISSNTTQSGPKN